MAISDYRAGKIVTTVPIGSGADGAAYDPKTHDVFVSNADGTLTVIHQDGADQYQVAQTLTTPIGSRNLGLDPETHRLYVASAKFGTLPADSKAKKKPVLPGTFTILRIEADSAAH
jgi:DNA-binding beta-propeller fold protein YncE